MTRVLLDEDIPIRLRRYFPDWVAVETVEYRGWKGLKNGPLLSAAEGAFDVLVTMDDSLPYQQHVPRHRLAVVILRARSKRIADLSALMPGLEQYLHDPQPGTVTRIFPPAD